MRLLALDLDDTLAAPNRRAADGALGLLREAHLKGFQLMLISGKPAAYLAGFARQMDVGSPLIAGENGAVVAASPDFPPRWERAVSVSSESRSWLEGIETEMRATFGESVWLQPNRVNLSVFWRSASASQDVISTVKARMNEQGEAMGFRSFVHGDCAEIVAPGADKGSALVYVLERLGIEAADAVAIGDSANDVPMFEVAGLSIGIGGQAGDKQFPDVEEALRWLLTNQA